MTSESSYDETYEIFRAEHSASCNTARDAGRQFAFELARAAAAQQARLSLSGEQPHLEALVAHDRDLP
jgi:hypothetical protein